MLILIMRPRGFQEYVTPSMHHMTCVTSQHMSHHSICHVACVIAYLIDITSWIMYGSAIILLEGTVQTSLHSKNRQTTKHTTNKAFEEQGIRCEEWVSRILETPDDQRLPRRGPVLEATIRVVFYRCL